MAEKQKMAEMGFIPAGAYRNRDYAAAGVCAAEGIPRAMQDICYDPQASGGLLIALPAEAAEDCLQNMINSGLAAAIIGSVTRKMEYDIYLT